MTTNTKENVKGNTKGKGKRKYTLDKGRFILSLLQLVFIIAITFMVHDVYTYPEKYLTIWKSQLQRELSKGNENAIAYYNDRYVSNGKFLFGEMYVNDPDMLDMNTVVGFETTETGLYLHTNDGNGYYIEK